jgi:hypothetical protein
MEQESSHSLIQENLCLPSWNHASIHLSPSDVYWNEPFQWCWDIKNPRISFVWVSILFQYCLQYWSCSLWSASSYSVCLLSNSTSCNSVTSFFNKWICQGESQLRVS